MITKDDVIMWLKEQSDWSVYCTLDDNTVALVRNEDGQHTIGVMPSFDHWMKFRPYDCMNAREQQIPDELVRVVRLFLKKLDRAYPLGQKQTIEIAKQMSKGQS